MEVVAQGILQLCRERLTCPCPEFVSTILRRRHRPSFQHRKAKNPFRKRQTRRRSCLHGGKFPCSGNMFTRDVVPFTHADVFLDLLCRLLPDSRSFQSGPVLIQAKYALHSLGRGNAVWLCTEEPPKNGQGSHAVRTADLDLLLAGPPMDHKYGCDPNSFISSHISPSYPLFTWS